VCSAPNQGKCAVRKEVLRMWGYRTACPKKAVCLEKGNTQKKVVGRTEVEKMTKEVKCVKCRRKGMNMVFIPISAARGKMCPGCKKGKERSINTACPDGGEAQLNRNW